MGWSIGFDSNWNRYVGYGVPAFCDHPGCREEIDRGLTFVCGGEPYGGEYGCGLHFCSKHRRFAGKSREHVELCIRCRHGRSPHSPSTEHPDWMRHQLRDASWAEWRKENPELVAAIRVALKPTTDRKEPRA